VDWKAEYSALSSMFTATIHTVMFNHVRLSLNNKRLLTYLLT